MHGRLSRGMYLCVVVQELVPACVEEEPARELDERSIVADKRMAHPGEVVRKVDVIVVKV